MTRDSFIEEGPPTTSNRAAQVVTLRSGRSPSGNSRRGKFRSEPGSTPGKRAFCQFFLKSLWNLGFSCLLMSIVHCTMFFCDPVP
ncbi:hypothetical protein VUR80DRAFT_1658 [Thermomyces stellatus]